EASIVTLAIILTAHVFPPMAWYTTDGVTMASAGAALALSASPRKRIIGWLLLGFAPLCKQNFAFVAAAAFVLVPELRWRERIWIALPPALYAIILLVSGGMGPALHQLAAATNLPNAVG